MASLYLIWQENGVTLTGENTAWLNNNLTFDINYPGKVTEGHVITVMSSAQVNKTYNNLVNVKVYLSGDPLSVKIIQELWPTLGNGYNPQRTNLNGGLEISFDGGRNYTRFDVNNGYALQPSTWLVLPGVSMGTGGQDGVLGAFNIATFILRFTIPPGAVEFQKLNVSIALDFDVI